jgi:hypothetical protein
MTKLLALLGIAVGGYIGFLNRPAALLVGKLPFDKVILAGTNLQGIDKVFVSVARSSFNYMLIGAAIGLLCGIILGSLLFRSKKR